MEQLNDHEHNSLKKMFNELHGRMDQLGNKQMDQLFELIVDPDKLGHLVNENYLGHDLPDYSHSIKPIAEWLLPLWRLESDSSIGLREYLEAMAEKARGREKKLLAEDLHNYSLNMIVLFDHHEQQYVWRLWGALWLVEKLDLTECSDLIFLFLRQDYFFVDFYFGGDKMDVAQASIFHFFSNMPSKMYDFLKETKIVPDSRLPVFGAMALTASHVPQKRLVAVSYIIKYLDKVYDVSQRNGNMQNIESYVFMLAKNNIHEALPILKKIYDNSQFMRLSIADSTEVGLIMDEKSVEDSQIIEDFELSVDMVLQNAAEWDEYLNVDHHIQLDN